ncbi:hypothetical protein ACJJTC_011364 [Scirpophaga incertulas]
MITRAYSYLILLLYFTIFQFKNINALLKVDPLVKTNLGLIRGVRASDGDYAMFMGIPYAQVNVSNPFGAAIQQEPFDEIFEANDDSARCPQIEEFNNTLTGSLDCLHLNVYVPDTANSNNRLPVLVWIYGGGFRIGFAGRYVYGPRFLVRHDIILVTLNYRLGPYGFMCLDTPEVPGNQGLKDQLLALRWIKNNIDAFSGDPNKITLFGESAGGISIDFHLMSTKEKLFEKLILQSGTTVLPIYPLVHKDAAQQIVKHIGHEIDNVDEAIALLSSIDTDKVVAAASELNLLFYPCVEKQFENVDSFIIENWINQSNVPKVRNVPILIGYNSNELLISYLDKTPDFFSDLNIFYEKLSAGFKTSDPAFEGMVELVKQFYIGDGAISYDTRYDIGDFDSDFSYIHPTHRSISRYLANSAGKIFQYMFSYNGNRNFVKLRFNVTEGGAAHADEIGYLFDVRFIDEEITIDDQVIIDRITMLWTNFVKYGNPTPETSELLPVEWKPVTKTSALYYMNIDKELTLNTRAYNERMSFWDLFYKINKDLQILYPNYD